MDGPSEHLSWSELACKDGTEYPLKWRGDRALALAGVFEAIREACGGKPITILSAYRTPEYNKKVGGAPLSQHTQGRALDLRPPKGMSIAAFGKIILALAAKEGSPLKGFGWYSRWIHIDTRPSAKLAVWDYR